MKKLVNTSFLYFIFAMVGGVFYREFTKYMGFEGKTTLSLLHVHLLVLGTLLFLLLAIINKISSLKLEQQKSFKSFFVVHNLALPAMAAMLAVRGIVQVMQPEITHAQSAMISGIAGLTHILLTVSFVLMFKAIKAALTE